MIIYDIYIPKLIIVVVNIELLILHYEFTRFSRTCHLSSFYNLINIGRLHRLTAL